MARAGRRCGFRGGYGTVKVKLTDIYAFEKVESVFVNSESESTKALSSK